MRPSRPRSGDWSATAPATVIARRHAPPRRPSSTERWSDPQPCTPLPGLAEPCTTWRNRRSARAVRRPTPPCESSDHPAAVRMRIRIRESGRRSRHDRHGYCVRRTVVPGAGQAGRAKHGQTVMAVVAEFAAEGRAILLVEGIRSRGIVVVGHQLDCVGSPRQIWFAAILQAHAYQALAVFSDSIELADDNAGDVDKVSQALGLLQEHGSQPGGWLFPTTPRAGAPVRPLGRERGSTRISQGSPGP